MNIPLITSIAGLPLVLVSSISAEETALIEKLRHPSGPGLSGPGQSGPVFPFAVSPHFATLAGPDKNDPLRRQFMPDPREETVVPGELRDPLGEASRRVLPRLVRQYRDRALIRTTANCAGHCRFCFRRSLLAGEKARGGFLSAGETACDDFVSPEETAEIYRYTQHHSEIKELLLSGGDPLTASDEELERLFTGLRGGKAGGGSILFRVCSRIPVVFPDRVGGDLIGLFRRFRPLRMAVHINHPQELDGKVRNTLASIADAGIPVLVQTVLLKGINDRAETLAELFRLCAGLGLTPYYLFQLDLAPGASHFRVDLRRGLELYRKLAALVPGDALPAYALDLPGGGGKIRLREGIIAGEEKRPEGRVYLLEGPGKKRWRYPVDTSA
jgi:lysine 2,3-aminomutase